MKVRMVSRMPILGNSRRFWLLSVALWAFILCGWPKEVRAQVPVQLAPVLHPQFLDSTGKVLAAGELFTYAAGTTTLQTTYADSLGTIANPNPIPLDSSGAPSNASGAQVQIWITGAALKVCAYSSTLILQWCWDNILAPPFLAGSNAWTGSQTFAGSSTFNGAANLSGGGSLTGAFAGSPSFTGAPTFTGTPVFSNLQPFPTGISTDIINGTSVGGLLNVTGINGTAGNNGEGLNFTAGNGGTGSTSGGGITLSGGVGGSTGGIGGGLTIAGGNATSGNSAGGSLSISSGIGKGTATGGAININGGTGGSTAGVGSAISITAGGGGAGGNGGDLTLSPGALGAGGKNGSLLIAFGHLVGSTTIVPTCTATGFGATATCTVSPGGGDSWGLVSVAASGAAPTTTGTVVLTFTSSDLAMGAHGAICTWNLSQAGTGQWNARATVMPTGPATLTATANWDNNAVAVTVANTWDFTYFCGGTN